jgi:hypothetical protein
VVAAMTAPKDVKVMQSISSDATAGRYKRLSNFYFSPFCLFLVGGLSADSDEARYSHASYLTHAAS